MNGQQERTSTEGQPSLFRPGDGSGGDARLHNEGKREHLIGDKALLSSRALLPRFLELQHQAAKHLEHEDAEKRRVLKHTLADLVFQARHIDPSVQVYGRIKTAASISDKMSSNGLGAHQVLDIIGVRAVTQHERDCYRLVNRIHGEFEVLEDEYDDYIATPKPNGYRSIHTTVISPCGFPVEIQIRTWRMHVIAERGSASHRQYKRDRRSLVSVLDATGWFTELLVDLN
jgi:GTP pyrophosphokinase